MRGPCERPAERPPAKLVRVTDDGQPTAVYRVTFVGNAVPTVISAREPVPTASASPDESLTAYLAVLYSMASSPYHGRFRDD